MSTRVNHNENKNTYTITYTFADGNTSVVEVSEEIANVIIDLDHREELDERRETRRHCSIHAYDPDGTRIADDTDIVRDLIENEEYELLHRAIAQLSERQKHLIYEVYFNNKSFSQIAREEGKHKSSIIETTKDALAKLKKFLKNF
jgi:RNA polymerase sigma factor (sigma-70 family)